MGKPAASILGCDQGQRLSNGLLERFACASPNTAQKGLQFGESLLDRREIRRIGRQKQEAAALGFNGLPNPCSLMNAQIIQDHDLSRAQSGCEDVLNVECKGARVSSSIQNEGFSHALQRQGSHQRHSGSIVPSHPPCGPFSTRRASITGGPRNGGATFIKKGQLTTFQFHWLPAPGC